MSISFNDLNDLLSQVSIVNLQGTHPFTFSGFSRLELEAMLTNPECDGIIFLPAMLKPENRLTLLAVAVDDMGGGIGNVISPAILSECPPRCKEVPTKENLASRFTPEIKIKTSVI